MWWKKESVRRFIIVEGNPLEDLSVIKATRNGLDAEPRNPEIDTIVNTK
ncbi:hypothetical protein O9992_30880 [Vibrio lentus]|nr:hypothetical protein [Vibrio lentus]